MDNCQKLVIFMKQEKFWSWMGVGTWGELWQVSSFIETNLRMKDGVRGLRSMSTQLGHSLTFILWPLCLCPLSCHLRNVCLFVWNSITNIVITAAMFRSVRGKLTDSHKTNSSIFCILWLTSGLILTGIVLMIGGGIHVKYLNSFQIQFSLFQIWERAAPVLDYGAPGGKFEQLERELELLSEQPYFGRVNNVTVAVRGETAYLPCRVKYIQDGYMVRPSQSHRWLS